MLHIVGRIHCTLYYTHIYTIYVRYIGRYIERSLEGFLRSSCSLGVCLSPECIVGCLYL